MALGAILGAVSIGSSLLGFGRQKTARRRQRRVDRLQAQRAAIQNVRNRRSALASLRRSQAQNRVAAIASGVAGGSSERATASSIQAQGIEGIAYHDQMEEMGVNINQDIRRTNRALGQASAYSAVGQLAQGVQGFADAYRTPDTGQVQAPQLPQQ